MAKQNKLYKYVDEPIVLADYAVVEACTCSDVVLEEFQDIKKLGEEMIKMCAEKGGLGLAAPQVGVMKKMFVWMNGQNSFQIVLNPQFFPDKKTTNVVEGCLTYPDEHFYLTRHKTGNARYEILDPNDNTKFKKIFKKLSGERALVWQHELDHLDGYTIAMKGQRFSVGNNE